MTSWQNYNSVACGCPSARHLSSGGGCVKSSNDVFFFFGGGGGGGGEGEVVVFFLLGSQLFFITLSVVLHYIVKVDTFNYRRRFSPICL